MDLYNARDLEKYMTLFSDDVVLEDLLTNNVLLRGKEAARARYFDRFKTPVHCNVLGRLAIGQVVRLLSSHLEPPLADAFSIPYLRCSYEQQLYIEFIPDRHRCPTATLFASALCSVAPPRRTRCALRLFLFLFLFLFLLFTKRARAGGGPGNHHGPAGRRFILNYYCYYRKLSSPILSLIIIIIIDYHHQYYDRLRAGGGPGNHHGPAGRGGGGVPRRVPRRRRRPHRPRSGEANNKNNKNK